MHFFYCTAHDVFRVRYNIEFSDQNITNPISKNIVLQSADSFKELGDSHEDLRHHVFIFCICFMCYFIYCSAIEKKMK